MQKNNYIREEMIKSINNMDLSIIKKYNEQGFTLDNVHDGIAPIILAHHIGFHDAWKLIIDGGTTIAVYNNYIDCITLDIFLYFVEKGLDPRSKIDGVPIIMKTSRSVIDYYLSTKQMYVFNALTDNNLSIMGYRQIMQKEFFPYVTYDDLTLLYEILDEDKIDFLTNNNFSLNQGILFNTKINRSAYMRRLPLLKNLGIPLYDKKEIISIYNAGYDYGDLEIIWLIENNPDIELMKELVKYIKNLNLEGISILGRNTKIIDFVLEYGGKTPQSTLDKAVEENNTELINVCLKHGMSVIN